MTRRPRPPLRYPPLADSPGWDTLRKPFAQQAELAARLDHLKALLAQRPPAYARRLSRKE